MGTHPIFESDFDCLTESEMAKGKKGKKGGKNNEDEEFDRIEKEMAQKKAAAGKQIPDPASVSEFPSMDAQSKKSKKKAKKNSIFADLENELDNPELKKLEEADIEPVLSKSQQKKMKREQRKKGANIQLDSAGEEEEEIPIPTKKGAKNKGKASFADLVSDEEEESEEETPAPKKGNKGGKGKKGKG